MSRMLKTLCLLVACITISTATEIRWELSWDGLFSMTERFVDLAWAGLFAYGATTES